MNTAGELRESCADSKTPNWTYSNNRISQTNIQTDLHHKTQHINLVLFLLTIPFLSAYRDTFQKIKTSLQDKPKINFTKKLFSEKNSFNNRARIKWLLTSIWNQICSFLQTWAISIKGSNAPRTVVPAVAHTKKGTRPLFLACCIACCSAFTSILPNESVLT